jgi:cytochrome c6
VILVLSAADLNAAEKKESKGEKLFQQHCAACHPNGGNIIKPAMTLHKKEMDANGVKTAKDIVGKMRNPGPGMTRFDTKTVSDRDAKEIAQYILEAYK